jgi:hypothetical protein
MNSIRLTLAARGRRTGESAYMILLIIACVALAVAVFFPAFEYFMLYRGDPVAYKWDPGATVRTTAAPARRARPEPAPAPAGGQDTGGVTAPEPVDEAPSADSAQPTTYKGLMDDGRMARTSTYRGPLREQ